MKIMRAYKYRLYPTTEQEARLSAWVAAVRTVYNAALEQRKMYGRPKGTDPHYRGCRFSSIRQGREIGSRKLKQDDELEWIADAALDADNRRGVVELILEAKARGAGVVGIFHDDEVREAVADKVFDLRNFAAAA